MTEYERRKPEQTLLHQVVREQLETFLARAQCRDQNPPRFVEQELRSFLRCGVLAHGFLRLHCDDCGQDRLVAFSCKRRGFCPACGGRRMANTAAHLVDRVLPELPIRQWVLTLLYPLRYRCAYDARLTSAVLRAFIRALFAELRRRSREAWGTRARQCGAVTFIQRFGSALNLNVAFHTLALDGAYAHTLGRGQAPRFLPLPPPHADAVARVLAGTARRIRRLIEERAGEEEDALARDAPLLALLASVSLRTRIASGARRGEPWRRLGDRVEPRESAVSGADPEASARVPEHSGMSLHAAVAVPARDRRRLERLCRYDARPPLANERLEERSDGRLALRLKTRWRDGTTHILMERGELIERLVPLIPPPRVHQVRYHGILAPGASQRDRVVPGRAIEPSVDRTKGRIGEGSAPAAQTPRRSSPPPDKPSYTAGPRPNLGNPSDDREAGRAETEPRSRTDPRDGARRTRWASLLQRVFEVDALCCPRCGSSMRLIAAIEDPAVAHKILESLKLPARAPPLEPPATDPPEPGCAEDDWGSEQSFPDEP